MFSTLDALSFKELNSQAPHLKSGKSIHSFIDSTDKKTRSRTGCLNCRHKRKKKCDEVHPICGSCKSRNLECVWAIQEFNPGSINKEPSYKVDKPSTNYKVKKFLLRPTSDSDESLDRPKTPLDKSPEYASLEEKLNSNYQLDDAIIELPHHSTTPSHSPFNHFDPTASFSPFLKSILALPNTPDHMDLASHELNTEDLSEENSLALINTDILYRSPSDTFSLHLDEKGLQLLDIYKNKISRMITISDESSNYFLKTFLTLGANEESILNILAAWGGILHEGPESSIVTHYKEKSKSLIEKKYLSKTSMTKFDYFVLFAYYLIDIGSEIFSGDTSKWHTAFLKANNLLLDYGSVSKFLKDFNYSNDAKFLVSNFQFHDIMSSETLTAGTSCKIGTYLNIFENEDDLNNYGLDPYQGCIQPLYLILGEILNTSVEFKKVREGLNDKMEELSKKIIIDNVGWFNLNEERIKYFINVDIKFNELLEKVNHCAPNRDQVKILSNNMRELENHLTLFELYRNTCKIYLLLYIKQTQPKSSEVQLLLLDCFKLIDILIVSHLKTSLVMALLVCGICCTTKIDRVEIKNKFNKVYSDYKVGNVCKALKIVEECWRQNPDGNLCIDWVSICNDFGWKLSVC